MFIRWGNSCSTKFRVTNGVKQGGILFPALFNVYMNNLSVSLNHSSIGGSLTLTCAEGRFRPGLQNPQ